MCSAGSSTNTATQHERNQSPSRLVTAKTLNLHPTRSGTDEPLEYQLELAQLCAAAGVDIVFGHGPHKVQAVAYVDGMPVVYSLGNFLMDLDLPAFFGTFGVLVQLSTDDRTIELVPVFRDGATPRPATSSEREIFAETIGGMSAPFGVRVITQDHRVVMLPSIGQG